MTQPAPIPTPIPTLDPDPRRALQRFLADGRFAARGAVITETTFNWSRNQLSRHSSWAGWLADGFGVKRRLAVLQRHRLLDAAAARRLRATAQTMAGWR